MSRDEHSLDSFVQGLPLGFVVSLSVNLRLDLFVLTLHIYRVKIL
jgi:hypothetical protein